MERRSDTIFLIDANESIMMRMTLMCITDCHGNKNVFPAILECLHIYTLCVYLDVRPYRYFKVVAYFGGLLVTCQCL